MALNIPGLVVMALFYIVILSTGIWASMRSKRVENKYSGDGMEITLLAGRNINLLVGIFTLTGKAKYMVFVWENPKLASDDTKVLERSVEKPF